MIYEECQKGRGSGIPPNFSPKRRISKSLSLIAFLISVASKFFISTFIPIFPHCSLIFSAALIKDGLSVVLIVKESSISSSGTVKQISLSFLIVLVPTFPFPLSSPLGTKMSSLYFSWKRITASFVWFPKYPLISPVYISGSCFKHS